MRISLLVAVMPLLLVPAAAAAQTDMYDGRPTFAEGVDLGYYVWRDGDIWQLRWTTKGLMRHFMGSVTADGGKLKSLKRIDVESESKVLYPGRPRRLVVVGPRGRTRVRGGRAPVVVTREQDMIEMDGDHRIVFNARTRDDIDGFSFRVDDKVDAIRLVLDIGGQQMANVVETGRHNRKAETLPLVVRLK